MPLDFSSFLRTFCFIVTSILSARLSPTAVLSARLLGGCRQDFLSTLQALALGDHCRRASSRPSALAFLSAPPGVLAGHGHTGFSVFTSVPCLMLPITPHTLLGMQYPLSFCPFQTPFPGTFPKAWALHVTFLSLSSCPTLFPGCVLVPRALPTVTSSCHLAHVAVQSLL